MKRERFWIAASILAALILLGWIAREARADVLDTTWREGDHVIAPIWCRTVDAAVAFAQVPAGGALGTVPIVRDNCRINHRHLTVIIGGFSAGPYHDGERSWSVWTVYSPSAAPWLWFAALPDDAGPHKLEHARR